MKKIMLKSVSTESFAKFGFWAGVILGALGVLFKIIFPQSNVTAGIPFFSYGATRTFFGLVGFFFIAVIMATADLILLAVFINIILKLSKGIAIYCEEEE